MNGSSLQWLPGLPQILSEHQVAGQQPDNLCGPYWIAVFLRSQSIPTTAEQVAQIAGSVLPIGNPATWLPHKAPSRQDYALPLPATDNLQDAGTSAQGLVNAVEQLTKGAYGLLPVQANWTGDRVLKLLRLCQEHPEWQAIPLGNLKTSHLWGASLSIGDMLAYLQGGAVTPPKADWSVGHFLVLAGWMQGPANNLIWICDTYPHFGWQGFHVQSPAGVAQALNRGDGDGGGVLLFLPQEHEASAAAKFQKKGFTIEIWDNGSPIPA